MTNDEHIKRLDQIAKQIRALSDAVKLRILALIAEGVPERKAIRQVMAGFSDEFIVLFTAEFSLRIGREITVLQAKKLKVGKITLSQRLSINSVEASATVQRLVREHVKGFQDARKLARTLYEGYGFTDADLKLQGKLPKYLLKNLDKSLAKSLKTPALRSAYLLAIKQLESGAGKAALEKSLQIAVFEKNRYIANRIAQHELSLVHHNGEALKLMDRDDVDIVEFRLSRTHPVRDICNLYAEQDRYGLGKGIYPKAFAPVPPIHPHCLLGGTLITSSGRISAVSKRWYDGDIVIITTSSGKRLSATVNHPILTRSGWVGAGFLNVGSEVITRAGGEVVGSRIPLNNKHKNVPPSISQITDSFLASGQMSAREVKTSAKHFHGDGMAGQVAIIGANSELLDGLLPHHSKIGFNHFFKPTNAVFVRLIGNCCFDFVLKRFWFSSHGVMSVLNKLHSLLFARFRHSQVHCLGRVSDPVSSLFDDCIDWGATETDLFGDRKNRSPTEIFGDDIVADRIVSVERKSVSCHVYNLETNQGHYTGNGIITHNCRCNIHTRLDLTGKKPVFHPASERTYLRKLSKPEQGRVMGSKDKAAQVLSGRDSLKVMNKGRPKEYRIRTVGEV